MTKSMRQSTLQALGLGSVTDIFRTGRLPVNVGELVDRVFGGPTERGSLIVSGANGIVGAGKMMQLTSRLEPFGVRSIGLCRPGTADGIGPKYPGLVKAIGRARGSCHGKYRPHDLRRDPPSGGPEEVAPPFSSGGNSGNP